MALCSASLTPIVIVLSLLLAPGCPRLPARNQRPIFDRRELQQGIDVGSGTQQPHDECSINCRPAQFYPPVTGITNSPTLGTPSLPQPPPPIEDGCELDGMCRPPWPQTGEPGPPPSGSPSGPTPVFPSPYPPPPHPPKQNEHLPKGNANRNVSPTDEAEQGKKSNSKVASAVGWVFLAAALALQVILGSYLAYMRRELEPISTRLEKVPSVSPTPSPAGFASSTTAL